MSKLSKRARVAFSIVTAATTLAAASAAEAADKFKITSVECEMSWLWKHTPVVHYDIDDPHKADYATNPDADYFRAAAERTAEYCDRTSPRAESPMNPPRRIRGIRFQSNDGDFKVLFDLDRAAADSSAGILNRIGDRHAAEQQAIVRHEAELAAIRTRDARAQQIKEAETKAAQDKATAEAARQNLFFDR